MKTSSRTIRVLAAVFVGLVGSIPAFGQGANGRPQFTYEQLARERSVKARHEASLLALPGVLGVGIAERNGKPVIVALVDEDSKVPRLPPFLEDVQVVAEPAHPGYYLNGGSSCNNYPVGCHSAEFPFPVPMGVTTSSEAHYNAGTLGFKACDAVTKTLGYVSANHVAAGVPTAADPFCSNGPIGMREAHPGLFELDPACAEDDNCAGNPTVFSNEVGILERVVPVVAPPSRNKIDAAFVASSDELTSASILDIGIPSSSPGTPVLNGCVRKSGRTTGLTHGRIDMLDITLIDTFDECFPASPVFEEIIGVRPDNNCGLCNGQSCGEFAVGGDSGSALVNASNQIVGLVFARESGLNGRVYSATIQNVLSGLGLTLDLNQCAKQQPLGWLEAVYHVILKNP